MIDQIKNKLSNLSSSGSDSVKTETKKPSVKIEKVDETTQTRPKTDTGVVSKFITKEKIKDMAKAPPIDQASTTRIKNAISNGSYPLDLDKIADALFDAYKEMKD